MGFHVLTRGFPLQNTKTAENTLNREAFCLWKNAFLFKTKLIWNKILGYRGIVDNSSRFTPYQ